MQTLTDRLEMGRSLFASKLLDFELASNNGNWQWVAEQDAMRTYFRVFNPMEQLKKFDPNHSYINRWIKDLQTFDYPAPIVEHKMARERAIAQYKKGC